jgi:NADH-quinone oxidoreductase subunit E
MTSSDLEHIVARYHYDESALIGILQDLQKKEGYLPQDVLEELSRLMEVSLAQIYGLATFYKSFYLKPRGRHCVTVCMGTACHVRGARRVLDRTKRLIGIEPGGTSPDLKFSLETVNCLGCCALGPMVVVDGEYHDHVSHSQVGKLLDSCE